MQVKIEVDSGTPVYRQIVDGLRIALVNGELAPGAMLPPVRRLALDLGVHFNTVAQAYRALAQEQWLDISARGGARIRERPVRASANPEEEATFRKRIEELVALMQTRGLTRKRLARELRRVAATLESE